MTETNRRTHEIPCTNPDCDNTTKVGAALKDAKQHCGECDMEHEDSREFKELVWQINDIDAYNIATLSNVCGEQERVMGWREKERTFGEFIGLVHSELSEALEEHRDGYPPDVGYNPLVMPTDNLNVMHHGFKPEGIPFELADVVIRVLAYCEKEDINIMDAIRIKLRHNLTRGKRHGGKKI